MTFIRGTYTFLTVQDSSEPKIPAMASKAAGESAKKLVHRFSFPDRSVKGVSRDLAMRAQMADTLLMDSHTSMGKYAPSETGRGGIGGGQALFAAHGSCRDAGAQRAAWTVDQGARDHRTST